MRGQERQVAIYARVSSEQQAEAGTIASQLAALRERVAADAFPLRQELEFVDDGYSGATLVRPALERLRDLTAAGVVDMVYVHSPDRLARKYAYQVLLVEEWQRAGVEVVFLNQGLGQTPEDALLLQVQGMMAEYERAKIQERSRRGKLHAARRGAVSVFSAAPYGYRYIDRHEGGGEARLEIIPEEARVVHRLFEWVGERRATIGEVCRRLREAGEPTRTGKSRWARNTVWQMLTNPAYKGVAAYGRRRVGPMRLRLRPHRGAPEQPRRAYSLYKVPSQEWIVVPVPAIVDEDLFEATQEQLRENAARARQQRRSPGRFLLQGLAVCRRCGFAYCGITRRRSKSARGYSYYRCMGADAHACGGQRVCSNARVRTDVLEGGVWQQVRELLEDPQRLEEEYRRRLESSESVAKGFDLAHPEMQMGKLRRGIARLVDSYADGVIEKAEFEPRIKRMKERLELITEQKRQLRSEESIRSELRLVVGRREDFAAKVWDGLQSADWQTQREIIRALVRRVEVDEDQICVVFRVSPRAVAQGPERAGWQHCPRGDRLHSRCRRHRRHSPPPALQGTGPARAARRRLPCSRALASPNPPQTPPCMIAGS